MELQAAFSLVILALYDQFVKKIHSVSLNTKHWSKLLVCLLEIELFKSELHVELLKINVGLVLVPKSSLDSKSSQLNCGHIERQQRNMQL